MSDPFGSLPGCVALNSIFAAPVAPKDNDPPPVSELLEVLPETLLEPELLSLIGISLALPTGENENQVCLSVFFCVVHVWVGMLSDSGEPF